MNNSFFLYLRFPGGGGGEREEEENKNGVGAHNQMTAISFYKNAQSSLAMREAFLNSGREKAQA